MDLSEFKAFVEGIEHAFGNGAPSPEQWQLIKDKLYQVDQEKPPAFSKRNFDRVLGDSMRLTRPYKWPDYRTAPLYGTIRGGVADE